MSNKFLSEKTYVTKSTHDSSSNDKYCDWFEQVHAEENALRSNKIAKENRKETDLLKMIVQMVEESILSNCRWICFVAHKTKFDSRVG